MIQVYTVVLEVLRQTRVVSTDALLQKLIMPFLINLGQDSQTQIPTGTQRIACISKIVKEYDCRDWWGPW